MQQPGNIHKAMVAIARDIDFIGKDRKNEKQNFKFRGIDDLYNYLHDIICKHGVYLKAKVLNVGYDERTSNSGGTLLYTRVTMRYTFVHEDGSRSSTEAVGEAMDSGDKSSSKAMAIAQKYALLQAFTIPTVEEKDPDQQSHEVKPKAMQPDGRPMPKPTPAPSSAVISDAQRKRLFGISKTAGWTEEEVKALVKEIAGVDSTALIPRGKMYQQICDTIEGQANDSWTDQQLPEFVG